jgi:acyl carrier protein
MLKTTFGITLRDAEAGRVRAVSDLVALIQDRIAAAHEVRCPTLPAFLSLRAAVRDIKRECSLRIRPHHDVAAILTAPQRRELWKRLSVLLGSAPRELRRPPRLRAILASSVFALLLLAVIAALALDIRTLPLTLLLAALAIMFLHVSTVPFRTVPPDGWITFADVTARIVGATVATKHLQLRTADSVLDELRPIIVNVLGVDPNKVVPAARFVEDLGVG